MNNTAQFKRVDYLVKSLLKHQIRDVFISPGSRNAPLMIAFTKNKGFQLRSVLDERSAGFQALGSVDMSQQPAVITCTSGSAVANYYPAVVEAFFRRKPLLILSADRPKDKINIRDGQTIFQEQIFGNHVLGYFELKMTEESADEDKVNIQKALGLLFKTGGSGPVHINIPLEEPLYEYVESDEHIREYIKEEDIQEEPFPEDEFFDYLAQVKKIALLIGQDLPDATALEYLNDVNVKSPFLVIDGGLGNTPFTKCIKHPNALIDQELDAPDLLISTGQEVLHKNFKLWLRSQENLKHWHFEKGFAPDTFGKLTRKFIGWGLKDLLYYLASKDWSQYPKDWKINWLEKQKEYYIDQKHKLEKLAFVDKYVLYKVVEKIPFYSQVALGNSSLVRNFLEVNLNKDLRLFGNRGVAGIDGSLSTAVGMALKSQQPVFCLLGELSFFYDQNALLDPQLPNNLKILVLNNGGGEIFKMIAGPEKFPEIAPYQHTPRNLDTKALCEMRSIKRWVAQDKGSLSEALESWIRSDELGVIEVKMSS